MSEKTEATLPDIGAMVAEEIAELRRVYPCRVVRASGIGYFDEAEGGCLRRGVYSQTNWKDQQLPDPGLQEIFAEGNMQEDACRPKLMEWLKKRGLVLRSGPPKAKEWDGLSGQIDGYLEPENGRWNFEIAVEEFKTLEYHRWERIESLDDFQKSPYMRAWLGQLQVYMLLEEIPLGCFLLKSKQAWRIKSFWVDLDYEWAERLLKVCDEIKKHVSDGTLPPKVEQECCTRCPFAHICLPDIVGSGNFEILDNPELAETLDRLGELKDAKKEIAALERTRKRLIPEDKTGICGNWMISGKWVEKKEYAVPESKYWQAKAEKLDIPEPKPQDAVLEKGKEA